MMKARKKLAVALALLLATGGSAFALGLGQIKVKSALDQPLKAVIPVVSATPAELRGLKVSLASSEDFQRAGISRERLQTPLNFKVEKRDGQTVIVVTSDKPVNDPALDLLLELNWSSGKLLREFSILLDPVGMPVAHTSQAPAVTSGATEKKPASTRTTRTAAAAKPRAGATATTAPEARSRTPDIDAGGSYKVRAGDNIWSIAQRSTRSAGEINRMMVAIQNANPDAFYKDNINALKKGAVLRIPERSAMAEINAGDAREEVRRQNQVWSNPGAASPSMMAGSSPSPTTASRAPGSSGGSRLELVPPKNANSDGSGRSGVAGGSGDAAVAGLKQDLARTKEALASEKQRSDDMASRVQDLEGIRDKNQRLLKMKDARIAELQAALAKANAAKPAPASTSPALEEDIFAPAATGTAATAAVAGTAIPAESASVAEAASAALAVSGSAPAGASTAAGALGSMTPATSAGAAPAASVAAPEATAAQEPESKPVQASPAPAVASQPWYMQTWAWIVGGLVILALLLFGFLKRRGGSGAETRSDRLSDALAGEDEETTHADDLGEDSEDEYALLEEIEQHPEELSLHLELASLYYAHRNEAKFEGAAEAMYAQVDDPSQPEWQQVRAMGEELCPDHPLFAELHTDGTATAESESSLADLVGEEQVTSSDADERHGDGGGYNFDFDLTPAGDEGSGSEPGAVDTPEADEPQDEDLLSLSSLAGADADEHGSDEPASEEFDADQVLGESGFAETIDEDTHAEDVPAAVDDANVGEAPSGEAETADEAAEQEFSSDPVDTKLDLARAYQDMGDDEGARAMLEEVLQEGSEAQKNAAQKLLDELG